MKSGERGFSADCGSLLCAQLQTVALQESLPKTQHFESTEKQKLPPTFMSTAPNNPQNSRVIGRSGAQELICATVSADIRRSACCVREPCSLAPVATDGLTWCSRLRGHGVPAPGKTDSGPTPTPRQRPDDDKVPVNLERLSRLLEL